MAVYQPPCDYTGSRCRLHRKSWSTHGKLSVSLKCLEHWTTVLTIEHELNITTDIRVLIVPTRKDKSISLHAVLTGWSLCSLFDFGFNNY